MKQRVTESVGAFMRGHAGCDASMFGAVPAGLQFRAGKVEIMP
jgi:hypothetical protein